MTFEEFDKFTDELFAECRAMRDSKGKEYAGTADRFGNFNRLAEKLGLPREKILSVYLTKHLDAIDNFIRDRKVYSEPIRGRIVDAIVYLSLLAGMIDEERTAKRVADPTSLPVAEIDYVRPPKLPNRREI